MTQPTRLALRSLLGAALLALPAVAPGHHSAGDGDRTLKLTMVNRQLAFHHRTEVLEVWGHVSPPSAAEGDEVRVDLQVRWREAPYLGPARVALTDRLGARVERALERSVDGTYRAVLRADLPDGDAILLELPGAGAGVVSVPYEVRARLAGTAVLLLGGLLAGAGALLALLTRALLRGPSAPGSGPPSHGEAGRAARRPRLGRSGQRHAPGALNLHAPESAAPAALGTGQVDRYLHLLRVRRKAPTWTALEELVAAHLVRVPFENLSKLYRHKHLSETGLPGIDSFLEGIERFHFGGTCYSNNYHLYSLLLSLGYQARLCGADMRSPDSHLVIMVRLEGRDYLVDGGYGGPFLRPLPLDARADLEIALGRDRYVLRARDPARRSRLELHRDGRLVHGYLAKPEPRRIEEFGEVIRQSFHPDAIFLNAVVLVRFTEGRSITIQNRALIRSEGDRTEITLLRDRHEQIEEIERWFGIPEPIAAAALAGLRAEEDPWA